MRATRLSSLARQSAQQATRAATWLPSPSRRACSDGGSRRRLGDVVLHQVPGGVEGQGEGAQLGRLDARGAEQQQGALEVGVVEQLVQGPGPAAVEGHRRGDLVEHLDPWRQLGLDRVLGEDALGERVQGADGCAVELAERDAGPLRLGRPAGVGGQGLEVLADAVPQLCCGLLGEGDGGDGPQLHGAAGHQRHHPADQR
jgi:hypothetical protein